MFVIAPNPANPFADIGSVIYVTPAVEDIEVAALNCAWNSADFPTILNLPLDVAAPTTVKPLNAVLKDCHLSRPIKSA